MAGLRYDVVADIDGDLVRIQVKSTSCKRRDHKDKTNRPPGYIFRIKDGKQKKYAPGSFDLIAFVTIDTQQVAYIPAHENAHRSQFTFFGNDISNHPLKAAYERQRSNQKASLPSSRRIRTVSKGRRRPKKSILHRPS